MGVRPLDLDSDGQGSRRHGHPPEDPKPTAEKAARCCSRRSLLKLSSWSGAKSKGKDLLFALRATTSRKGRVSDPAAGRTNQTRARTLVRALRLYLIKPSSISR